eukprot:3614774-Amphidinium_carterae.1
MVIAKKIVSILPGSPIVLILNVMKWKSEWLFLRSGLVQVCWLKAQHTKMTTVPSATLRSHVNLSVQSLGIWMLARSVGRCTRVWVPCFKFRKCHVHDDALNDTD